MEFRVNFRGVVDDWAYPKFQLASKIDPNVYSGFVIRGRVMKNSRNVALIADSADAAPTFWVSDLFPSDGNRYVVYVPFTDFKPGSLALGNQNAALEPELWKQLWIGMGSRVADNGFEISNLILVKGN